MPGGTTIKSEVFIFLIDKYDPEKLLSAIGEVFSVLGLHSEFRGKTVLLKPNMLISSSPESAVCTHPEVIRALIRNLPESVVTVGDSPALGSTRMVAQHVGILDICRQEGALLVDFRDPVPVAVRDTSYCQTLPIASAVVRADVVISAAKLKTHGLMRYTGAVKNLMGCLPGKAKADMHFRLQDTELFAGMLVDIYKTVAPALSIVDGIVAMEGNGPRSGTPRNVGVLLAGIDGVAVDAVACAVVGIEPMSVQTVRLAHERGIGCGDLRQITIRGSALPKIKVRNFKQISGSASSMKNIPPIIKNLAKEQLTARPHINKTSCTGCAVCSQICPTGAISVEKEAVIDYQACIRCYCCQELCGQGAIVLQKRGLGRLL